MSTTSTAPLTPLMVEAIKATAPEDVMAGGATRTGLIRRGLVHSHDSDRFGKLTEGGLLLRAKMLPAPAPEVVDAAREDEDRTAAERHADSRAYHAELAAPIKARNEVVDVAKTLAQRVETNPRLVEDPAKAAQINAWLERHGITVGALTPGAVSRLSDQYWSAVAADWTEAMYEDQSIPEFTAGTVELDPIRKRFHGMNLGQRRDRRKAQRKARKKTRARNR